MQVTKTQQKPAPKVKKKSGRQLKPYKEGVSDNKIRISSRVINHAKETADRMNLPGGYRHVIEAVFMSFHDQWPDNATPSSDLLDEIGTLPLAENKTRFAPAILTLASTTAARLKLPGGARTVIEAVYLSFHQQWPPSPPAREPEAE